jgi:hypothetical protein
LFSQEHLSYTFQYLFPTLIRLELLSPGTSKALPTFVCAFINEVFLLWLILLLLLSFQALVTLSTADSFEVEETCAIVLDCGLGRLIFQ